MATLGSFGIWTMTLDQVPVGRAQELAAEIEALGYGAIWVADAMGRDVMLSAAQLLSATSKLALATGIASIYSRDAIATACAERTIHDAYGDRFVLGLGVSHAPFIEGARGHTFTPPLATMRRYLDKMQSSPWTGRPLSVEPTRVLAALGPKMLALAGELTAGAHPYNVTAEHTAKARAILGPGKILAPDQKIIMSTDAEAARELARSRLAMPLTMPNYRNNFLRMGFTDDDLAHGGSNRLVDAIFAWGPIDRLVARIREHIDAGASHVAINVTSPDGQPPVAAWRDLAAALELR